MEIIAGAMFLLSLFVPSLNWIFISSKIIVNKEPLTTAKNILAFESMFRLNILNELITSTVAIVLAFSLFQLLKQINKNFALLALLLKSVEAVLLTVTALLDFITVQMLNGQTYARISESEQLQSFFGLFFNGRMALGGIPMIFLGPNMIIFFYLLLRSKYIPRALSGFGIFSYLLIFIFAVLNILAPRFATLEIIQIICFSPSVLTELIMGFWLLSRGLTSEPESNGVFRSS